ncbi:phosphatase [Vibrio phage Vp_R1]|uniref:Macro domain-containing protein n=1 Tax=Vibrio phage Vp_R1 TaxID=2059867 RepID=A0A2H5BQ02_9CAUD|nr:phosphatase [Vibrio phage Vp_R1]AUG88412.1 hypothetical protein VPR_048 [Vibrio phage Vp_R1]
MVKHAKSSEAFDAYMHQCNCFCRMGRGIAPQLAKAFPEVREVDMSTEVGDRSKMGTFTKTSEFPIIYNLYGQYHWTNYKVAPGRNTDYNKLAGALVRASNDMASCGHTTVGIPLIGCGLAGGDWNVVKPIVEGAFKANDIEVTLFIKE